jgi:phosphate transport system substrate-binding protein
MFIIDGSTATIPITAELYRQFYDASESSIEANPVVKHSTTHNAYMNLIDNKPRYSSGTYSRATSLIFVTPPSEEELHYARDAGVELEVTPIALDGFVFITHKDNPVDSLTVKQIQDIYQGKITNWKKVGGNNAKIRPFQREENSGSQTAMEQIVMQGKKMKPPKSRAYVSEFMGQLIELVAEYDNGPSSIGYTYNYYINNLYKNENIKIIKIDGISPDNENLRSGTYPFTSSYNAVIRADEPADSPARLLKNFLLTETGQDLVEMAGYCRAIE